MKLMKLLKKRTENRKVTAQVTKKTNDKAVVETLDSYVLEKTTLNLLQQYVGQLFTVDAPIENGNTVTFTLQDQSFWFTHTIRSMMPIDDDGTFVVSSSRGISLFRKMK